MANYGIDVVGVGTNSADEVIRIAGTLTGTLAAGKARVIARHLVPGGQTATVSAACAALGLRAAYLGAFGSDAAGRFVRGALERRGVNVSLSVDVEAPNRSAVIIVGDDGGRYVVWHRSEALVVPRQLLASAVLAAPLVHVDDDDVELALAAADAARRAGSQVTSDIEHAVDGVERLIAAVTWPIFDERLVREISGEADPERGLRRLRRLNDGVLVATRGAAGAVALEGDRFHSVPAFPVEVVDTTGAGDVFRAGFIYGLLRRWPIPGVLRFANAAAAVACTREGAIPSVPALGEVEALAGVSS